MRAGADAYQYPGDEVIYKAIGETLRRLGLESGMSVEQAEEAFREALAKTDYRATYRALGLTVKEERERSISRAELSRTSGLRLRDLILLERGQLSRLPAAYFFRISYALKISPPCWPAASRLFRKTSPVLARKYESRLELSSMAAQDQNRHRQKLNHDTFSNGINGKVLQSVSISNELSCRYISLEFEDKTELRSRWILTSREN